MNDVHFINQLFHTGVSLDSSLFGKCISLLGVDGKHALDIHMGTVNLLQTFVMKRCGKSRTDNARPNAFLFHLRFPFCDQLFLKFILWGKRTKLPADTVDSARIFSFGFNIGGRWKRK